MLTPKACNKIRILAIAIVFGYSIEEIRAGDSAGEDALKVAYIYNFVKFTQWPESAFRGSDSKLHLCAAGQNPLSGQMSELENKTVRNRTISVTYLDNNSLAEVQSNRCHLLYIDGGGKDLKSLPDQLTGLPVLLISDREGFVNKGGMIGLKIVEKKIRFEINLETASKNNITISSLLLKLAVNVYGA